MSKDNQRLPKTAKARLVFPDVLVIRNVFHTREWRNKDPEPRVGGGVQPKAEKKIVTSPFLMVEVVVNMPKGTLDGSQDVFESL